MTKINFLGSSGNMLAAKLDTPESGVIKSYALFAHCFTCTKEVLSTTRISNALTKNGIAVLRFDFSGLGESDGDFSNENFSSNIEDLVAAADFLKSNYEAPQILIGHSLGGTAVLAAAHKMPEAKAVVTIGSPANASHVVHQFKSSRKEIMDNGEAEVVLAGRPFKIKRQFIEDIEGSTIEDCVRNLRKSLLVMHSPLDETVSIDSASQIFSWAKHSKSFVSLDSADHLLRKREDAEYAANIIACWASRYIDSL